MHVSEDEKVLFVDGIEKNTEKQEILMFKNIDTDTLLATNNDENLLFEHLNVLFTSNKAIEGNKIKIKLTLLKGGAIVVGLTSGLPLIAAAKAYAGNNYILGNIYAGSIVTSVGILTLWSLLNYIDYTQQKIHDKNKFCKYCLFIVPIGFGVASACTGTIISLTYNTNIIFPIIAFLNDSINNTCSYNIAFSKTSRYITLKYQRLTYIQILSEQIQKRLEIGTRVIINMPRNQLEEFLDKYQLNEYFFTSAPIQQVDLLFLIRDLISLSKVITLRSNSSYRIIKYFNYVPSILLPSAWLSTTFKLVLDDIKNRWPVPVVPYIVAFFATAPVYVLEVYLTNLILNKTSNTIATICGRNYYWSLPYKYFLKTTICLSIMSLTIAGFCFAARAKVIDDQLSGIYHDLAFPITIISTIIFKSSAILDFIPNFINFFIQKFSTQEKKVLEKISDIIGKFNIALDNSTAKDLKKFIDMLDLKKILEENEEDEELCIAIKIYLEKTHFDTNANPPFLLEESWQDENLGNNRIDVIRNDNDQSTEKPMLHQFNTKKTQSENLNPEAVNSESFSNYKNTSRCNIL